MRGDRRELAARAAEHPAHHCRVSNRDRTGTLRIILAAQSLLLTFTQVAASDQVAHFGGEDRLHGRRGGNHLRVCTSNRTVVNQSTAAITIPTESSLVPMGWIRRQPRMPRTENAPVQ